MDAIKNHWEQIYKKKKPHELSWFQKEPSMSLRLIEESGIKKSDWIIDVGGGESFLINILLDRQFKNVSVLDISSAALEAKKNQLGDISDQVEWHESDIRNFKPPHKYQLWHDRALFHFLTKEEDRQYYLMVLHNALEANGHVIIATFASDGPKHCSGLEIIQYDPISLQSFFGDSFTLKSSRVETHNTPWNTEQKFIYFYFKKSP